MEEWKIGTRGVKVTTDYRVGEIRKNNFGTDMQIIVYRNYDDIDVMFLDEHRYVYEHNIYGNFKNGCIKNPYDRNIFGVGYMGVGKYNTGNAKQRTPEEYVWRGMFERCYGEKYKEKHPSYYGIVTVCEEWHNFQNFAEWYNTNIYQVGTERMHLDKDILVSENTIYSPETCLIVPQSINELFHVSGRKTVDTDLPYTIRRTTKGKYSVTYKSKSLGIYDTVDDCITVYIEAKRKDIKEKVEIMKNELPNKVKEALLNW